MCIYSSSLSRCAVSIHPTSSCFISPYSSKGCSSRTRHQLISVPSLSARLSNGSTREVLHARYIISCQVSTRAYCPAGGRIAAIDEFNPRNNVIRTTLTQLHLEELHDGQTPSSCTFRQRSQSSRFRIMLKASANML